MQEKLRAFFRKLPRRLVVFLGFIVAWLAIPQVFALIDPNAGLMVGAVAMLVGVILLFKPVPSWAVTRGIALGILIVGIATATVGSNKLNEQKAARLAALKQSNPTAYLAEIKKEKGDDAWRAALKEIDPKAYAVEEKRLAAERKAAKERAEKERIAAEKREKEKQIAEAKAEYEQRCSDKANAYVIAQEFVKRRLKAPATADFPWLRPDAVDYLGNCTHLVDSYVDAQNSFGANIRTYYRAKVKYTDDGNWELLDLTTQ